MKVYFTASIAAKDKYINYYKKIIDILAEGGHDIVADHIVKTTAEHIQTGTREERLKFHKKLEKWIQSCDFLVAETSFPSISVGYEISLALRLGKPVLILYSEGDAPSLLEHHKDDKMICEHYTPSNLRQIITEFIQYIEGKMDLRFTFFITPEIVQYLDDISRKQKVPKSVYLRNLIKRDMKAKGYR